MHAFIFDAPVLCSRLSDPLTVDLRNLNRLAKVIDLMAVRHFYIMSITVIFSSNIYCIFSSFRLLNIYLISHQKMFLAVWDDLEWQFAPEIHSFTCNDSDKPADDVNLDGMGSDYEAKAYRAWCAHFGFSRSQVWDWLRNPWSTWRWYVTHLCSVLFPRLKFVMVMCWC